MTLKSGDKSYYGLDKIRTDDRMRQKWPSLPPYISPLPFYPTLRRALRSHGAAVLLAYLEVFHWIDTQVVLAHVQQELQITKRSWWWVASAISTSHASTADRRTAQMAHREFVTPYSLTAVTPDRTTWELRRNQTTLDNLLQKAHITSAIIRQDAKKLTRRAIPKSDVNEGLQPKEPISAPNAVDHANKLSDIIENALTRSGVKRLDAQKLK
jgi:hypothetical protein